jgi:hypothetical protein
MLENWPHRIWKWILFPSFSFLPYMFGRRSLCWSYLGLGFSLWGDFKTRNLISLRVIGSFQVIYFSWALVVCISKQIVKFTSIKFPLYSCTLILISHGPFMKSFSFLTVMTFVFFHIPDTDGFCFFFPGQSS